MNIGQINTNLENLILNFNPESFISELLLAYGTLWLKNSQFKEDTLVKLNEKIKTLQVHLASLDDKMLDNQISSQDYQRMKTKIELEILELEGEMERFGTMKTNFDNEIDYSISLLKNLDKVLIY
ncbi:hypothetical protein JZU68_09015 [bacterium]|jgi:hypothetical protein|nr:hypothetical protein [bacterium]